MSPGSQTGRVARLLPFSAVDGPGNRSVVFLQGCDFNCSYCHNPETRPPVVARAAVRPDGTPAWPRLMSVDEVLAATVPWRPFIRGLTVSGGECGTQPEFLQALVLMAAEQGLPALVDTNGSLDYSLWPALAGVAEGFMLDIKAWDPAEHRALTGSGNVVVLANLHFLSGSGKLYEARTVVVPGAFDAELTVRETSRVLAASGSRSRYKLIRFRPYGVRVAWRDLPVPDGPAMERLAAIARSEGVAEVIVV